jgi:phosphopentomutase
MKKYNRIFTIVIDSLGVGEMNDSKEYGDVDVDTYIRISRKF